MNQTESQSEASSAIQKDQQQLALRRGRLWVGWVGCVSTDFEATLFGTNKSRGNHF